MSERRRARWSHHPRAAAAALLFGTALLAGPVAAEQPEVTVPWARLPGRAPLGAFATYEVRAENTLVSIMRVAVVGQRKDRSIVEVELDDAARDDDPPVRFQLEVAPDDPTAAPKAMLVQVAANAPMRVAAPTTIPLPNFATPKADTLVADEVITVTAGRFSTRHFRANAPDGTACDAWVDGGAGPLGLVKFEGRWRRSDGEFTVTLSLRSKGKGARASIVGTPSPYDEFLFMQQISASMPHADEREH